MLQFELKINSWNSNKTVSIFKYPRYNSFDNVVYNFSYFQWSQSYFYHPYPTKKHDYPLPPKLKEYIHKHQWET